MTVATLSPASATQTAANAATRQPGKLGLSLAGGGFRASLFHLGVLRRLAELDVLRRVEVLSTVSGGSITGALYVVLLKKYLEDPARVVVREATDGRVVELPQREYVALVDELERILVGGVQQNLRTRLLMNPLGVLLVMLTGDSLGRRMGRLYERHLFSRALRGMSVAPAPWWRPAWLWPGQLSLRDLAIRPAGEAIRDGTAAYNARQRREGGSALTGIVINATSLNSGGRFFFSSSEVGDWYLGYFRESEFDLLLARKALLALDDEALLRVASGSEPPPPQAGDAARGEYAWRPGEAARAAEFALRRRGVQAGTAEGWRAIFDAGFPGQLEHAAFGLLRPAKVAAWYLLAGSRRDPPILGGRSLAQHAAALRSTLREIDPDLDAALRTEIGDTAAATELLAGFVLELYYQRSAECVSANITDDWRNIRIGHAVGASACFPPVFPPFLLFGVYDDLHVPRLGLTDGGVYDNMGVTALLDEECTEVIASDTSGLFNTTPASTNGHVGLALRVPDLLMRALGGAQRAGLRERRRVSRMLEELSAPADGGPTSLQQQLAAFREQRALDELVYFHIASPRVEPADAADGSPGVPALRDIGVNALDVASLRTDLDSFGDVEIAALVNHGYDTTDRYVRRYAPAMVDAAAARRAPRAPYAFTGGNAEPARARTILRVGTARFFRALRLHAPVTWLFTLAASAAAVVLLWRSGITIEAAVAAGAALVDAELAWLNRIAGIIPGVSGPATQAHWLLPALLAVGVAGFLLGAARMPADRTQHGRDRPLTRRMRTALKWARALRGNLLWFVLGLPALLAAGIAALATTSWLFFHLPFLRRTRIDRRRRTDAEP